MVLHAMYTTQLNLRDICARLKSSPTRPQRAAHLTIFVHIACYTTKIVTIPSAKRAVKRKRSLVKRLWTWPSVAGHESLLPAEG